MFYFPRENTSFYILTLGSNSFTSVTFIINNRTESERFNNTNIKESKYFAFVKYKSQGVELILKIHNIYLRILMKFSSKSTVNGDISIDNYLMSKNIDRCGSCNFL